MEQQRREEIIATLKTVDDPELPSVSVFDLGMVHSVDVEQGLVTVKMIPTFIGCPALDMIKKDVKRAVEVLPWVEVCEVSFSMQEIWSTAAITEEGKTCLKKHGIAPPPEHYVVGEEWSVQCPYCESAYTSIENIFGPTACRSILYCRACKNPFEAMKPIIAQPVNDKK
ncbi:phenylacetate-CoA oxygenase subunit PaaJ [Halalkalibacterium halodurans]|uniref:1,2-phenylacetyl-CoA epoxidase subunit PaaD n=1 Tax=Halalkalibacterium halodurans TaxID=86665 RepID=UPI002E1E51F9|nr:1,2-phenylacetyl-CoA epoxidase subunit PaaD [Halalkalibacterium halodurans]MED4081298.1 phenylacetate-CoA oxygenase subunit PaaJ [Halalkalibacterium halodurans]MED4084013.1 phenylacetate-CoA oxygenase subunit PaaJ [Halalkalibacterium halodurans]MED4105982.1 phenylacetate-CoA oxygenase subunit PaaJ [Halalkalibacterium halodurans]MED4107344.1 phenylacetate-CoA oxygenase subunit PaaJ [Halalkalibacterium halodurans]MED4125882.1 phenylacetate-CoA oxygenase subunit PaaJ [Halalkalibacterium halodu